MDVWFEIVKHICVLRKCNDEWCKELNLVSWNGADPMFDIRQWNADHTQMTRGITLTSEEVVKLVSALAERSVTDETSH